jgi:rRNA large subunit m3Psi methyltransferase RlmH
VHTTPLNHIGLWIDDLAVAVEWLTAQGVRFAPGGIRKGAAGFDITFLIGGADGLDPSLKENAQAMWRLSSLTLPHAMARVVLVEQLYRAWTILQGHPYHRE